MRQRFQNLQCPETNTRFSEDFQMVEVGQPAYFASKKFIPPSSTADIFPWHQILTDGDCGEVINFFLHVCEILPVDVIVLINSCSAKK